MTELIIQFRTSEQYPKDLLFNNYQISNSVDRTPNPVVMLRMMKQVYFKLHSGHFQSKLKNLGT